MNRLNETSEKQPRYYWLVDIELTSGDILQFYVAAINAFEANKKAKEYAELACNNLLRKVYNKFALYP